MVAGDAWALWSTCPLSTCGTSKPAELLEHWNGTTWSQSLSGSPGHPCFFHRSSAGQWTKYSEPVPKGVGQGSIAGLVRIPGTTSMLAAGQVEYPSLGEVGVLWRYRA